MGLNVSNVHVDSSLLSDEASDFCSPPYATSFYNFLFAFTIIREVIPFNASHTLLNAESRTFSCSPFGAATVSRN